MTAAIYGTAADVAGLAGVWSKNGAFDATTVPTLSQVDTWLQKVSAQMDVSLSQNWFVLPIDVTLPNYTIIFDALSNVVVPLVADLVHDRNSSGRFHTQGAVERGVSIMKVITKDINAWVEEHADGLVELGLTRNVPTPEPVAAGYVVKISRS